ncbi:MAG: hypothetical protein NTY53_23480, partial [Kiritimatiellaeota bacterium]|nr:hypothetical protein [Kiritimatiellota bacterium]
MIMLTCMALGGVAVNGQLLTESFKGTTAPGWTISGNAFLTAPSLDTAGSGWLRLIPNLTDQAGAAICSTA